MVLQLKPDASRWINLFENGSTVVIALPSIIVSPLFGYNDNDACFYVLSGVMNTSRSFWVLA